MKTKIRAAFITVIVISLAVNAQDQTVNGKLTIKGVSSSHGSNSVYSTESGKTNFRLTINTLDAENSYIYNYDEDAKTFHTINLGGSHSLSSGLSILGNGNVGIGTTNPTEKLYINEGNIGFYGLNSSRYIRFTEGKKQGGFINYDGVKNILNIGVHETNSDDLAHDTNAVSIVRKTGNVGIGTTKPDAKLAVNGDIHTKEVKVDLNGWADFVFENDYELPSLAQVEKHIQEKGHLTDIPSAKEVAKKGVKLGEMNKKLLQKIEELTLYTIAQEKRLKTQDERHKKEEERNRRQESRLEKQDKENEELLSLVKALSKRIEKLEKN